MERVAEGKVFFNPSVGQWLVQFFLICHAIPLKQLDRILWNFRYMMKNIHVLCRCINCLKFCLFFFPFSYPNFKFKSLPTLNSLLKNVYPRNFPEPVQQLASKHPTLMLTVAFGNWINSTKSYFTDQITPGRIL